MLAGAVPLGGQRRQQPPRRDVWNLEHVRRALAGLGCPDWPGCYGRLAAPSHPEAVAAANAAFPERPVHSAKAWKEMAHRYL
ncbi:MAG: hypothetical protein HGB05_18670, partial [Chloroflexi bacterium]|nr:hypothetical protein [Chloroflexota bacterium]